LSAANTPVCITSYAVGDITGTYDLSNGESLLDATLRWRVHLGITEEAPCPRCGALEKRPDALVTLKIATGASIELGCPACSLG
jgi:hypothetical protein